MNYHTVYQPIMELQTGKIFGYESLIRGPSSPSEMFHRAEKNNQIIDFDIFSFQLALNSFPLKAADHLFINCRPETFVEGRIPELVQMSQLQGMDRVVVELTEQIPITNLPAAKLAAEDIKRLGIRIALDDFGHGFNNLAYIEHIKPDFIKLDKIITKNIVWNKKALQLIRGLIKLCDQVESVIIAEGIETFEQKELLQESGVRLGQGWYLGKPQPLQFESVSI